MVGNGLSVSNGSIHHGELKGPSIDNKRSHGMIELKKHDKGRIFPHNCFLPTSLNDV